MNFKYYLYNNKPIIYYKKFIRKNKISRNEVNIKFKCSNAIYLHIKALIFAMMYIIYRLSVVIIDYIIKYLVYLFSFDVFEVRTKITKFDRLQSG